MEKKMNHKSKSIQDILPLELIHRILLRVPAKHLARLKCVSKQWHSLISDPQFVELNFHHSPASTNASVFMEGGSVAHFVYLDSLFTDNNDALQVKKVSPPFQKKRSPHHFMFLGSCRGFVLFNRHPHFLVVWNPLTGSRRGISYSRVYSRSKYNGYSVSLYGFGYDASQDDYLVVLGWSAWERKDHLDCLSLRTNSWINLDAALSKPLGFFGGNSCGLFLNGAIHWLPLPLKAYSDAILIFDLKERTFSTISVSEQLACSFPRLTLLGGCLALYYSNNDGCNTDIWVMKEYKVHSSWTLYQIPCVNFRPLCLSNNGDIIVEQFIVNNEENKIKFLIYNVGGELLQRVKYLYSLLYLSGTNAMYTESLLSLPSVIKDKDKDKDKKKKRRERKCH